MLDDDDQPTAIVTTSEPFNGGHYAAFPSKLAESCVLASTSEHGCCGSCGAPWSRVLERKAPRGDWNPDRKTDLVRGRNRNKLGGAREWAQYEGPRSLGWEPSCSCNADVIPCTVLDPFGGSGTTAAVSLQHGRRSILCELSNDYVALIDARIANALNPRRTRRLPAVAAGQQSFAFGVDHVAR